VRRQLQLSGFFGGRTRQDLPLLIHYVAENRIDVGAVISNRYGFTELPQAILDLEEGKVIGSAVITV
jgi:S-(hydroxymethyl)glutathione dehydrogenase/alcohol dehydrogenase